MSIPSIQNIPWTITSLAIWFLSGRNRTSLRPSIHVQCNIQSGSHEDTVNYRIVDDANDDDDISGVSYVYLD